MTNPEIDRGGRPRQYDEDELIARIHSDEDFLLVEAALLEHSSHPTWARGCVEWLWRKRVGQPAGGQSSPTRYRRMLAEIPHDPLKPPGGRRRALRELASQRGGADLALVAGFAAAGAVALAVFSPSEAVRLLALGAAPIMPEQSPRAGGGDSDGVVVSLGRVFADGSRECVPGARGVPPAARVGYTRSELAA